MNKQTNKGRFFLLSTLMGVMALGGIAGCGEGALEPTERAQYTLTNALGPYGSTTGTPSGAGTAQHTTTVTKIVCYDSTDNVYGIRLYWGATSKMYGQTNGASAHTFNITGSPVYKIEYSTSSGNLRGLKFTNFESSLSCGNNSGPATALNDLDAEFTDLEVWTGLVNSVPVIWGAKLYYTTP